jgi:hypothetical protein
MYNRTSQLNISNKPPQCKNTTNAHQSQSYQRNTITNKPNTAPAIPAGTASFEPAPLELEAAGVELGVVAESSTTVGDKVPIEGKRKLKLY